MVNRLIAVGIVACMIALGLGEFRRVAVERALLKESIGRLEQQRDLANRYADSLARTVIVRARDFNSTVIRYRTSVDTLVITDTVQVRAALVAADTAIRACQSLVRDCTLAISAKDRVIANQDSTIRALKSLFPSPARNAASTVVKVGLGVLLGLVIK